MAAAKQQVEMAAGAVGERYTPVARPLSGQWNRPDPGHPEDRQEHPGSASTLLANIRACRTAKLTQGIETSQSGYLPRCGRPCVLSTYRHLSPEGGELGPSPTKSLGWVANALSSRSVLALSPADVPRFPGRSASSYHLYTLYISLWFGFAAGGNSGQRPSARHQKTVQNESVGRFRPFVVRIEP
jgi:hypothetical protein